MAEAKNSPSDPFAAWRDWMSQSETRVNGLLNEVMATEGFGRVMGVVTKAMVSMQGGRFVPIPFAEMLDPQTGRTRLRLVDVRSHRYAIARRYMIRLRRDDFENPELLANIAKTAGMSVEDFRREFEYLVASEQPPLSLESPSSG